MNRQSYSAKEIRAQADDLSYLMDCLKYKSFENEKWTGIPAGTQHYRKNDAWIEAPEVLEIIAKSSAGRAAAWYWEESGVYHWEIVSSDELMGKEAIVKTRIMELSDKVALVLLALGFATAHFAVYYYHESQNQPGESAKTKKDEVKDLEWGAGSYRPVHFDFTIQQVQPDEKFYSFQPLSVSTLGPLQEVAPTPKKTNVNEEVK